ncbi:3-deoxy-D-manno-octulosonic acid transferase [candidate division KSB1 bacterium]
MNRKKSPQEKMMTVIWFLLYNISVVPFLYLAFTVAGLFNRKVRDGITGRKGQVSVIKNALNNKGGGRKVILFHCVSVGEWEQSVPVIMKLKKTDPTLFIVVAFFSPSGYNYVRNHPDVDLKVYLPFDSYHGAKRFLRAVGPSLWVVSKHDIWPNHLFAAGKLNIPVVLIDATLPPDSKRIYPVIKNFNKCAYKNFDFIFPISEEDKNRFLSIYPFEERLLIAGDTRFDQVLNRAEKAKQADRIKLFDEENGVIFIGGSIWQPDEKHVMPALINMMSKYKDLKAVLVPHEPEEHHLQELEGTLDKASIGSTRLSSITETGKNETRVVIIDSIGLLARLYSQTDIAYVGGSFSTGVHNVMEPAVLDNPVIFGPRHLNSFEATELKRHGGGFTISSSEEMEEILDKLISDIEFRNESGKKAKELIYESFGATEIIFAKLKERYGFISGDNPDRDYDSV